MTSYYCFSEGFHVCRLGEVLVGLDINRGDYVFFNPSQVAMIDGIIGRSVSDDLPKALFNPIANLTQLKYLNKSTVNPSMVVTNRLRAKTSFLEDICSSPVQFDLRHLASFLFALAVGLRVSRVNSFKITVDLVKSWKVHPYRNSGTRLDSVSLRKLVANFHALTPYFFSTQDECFRRSIILLKFLSLRGVHADWVFGVRICPFKAHCWVESDGVVLNDFLDSTRSYEVILTV